MSLTDLNLNKNDKKYLIILFFVLLIPTIKMTYISWVGCISNPDVAVYLLTGLKYAGLDKFNVVFSEDLFYTPIISFLSSLLFRLGYVDKNAIIIVTTIINFLGYFGLYILLRNRFKPFLSFIGVIIYCSLPIVILNAFRGMIDISAVSISIWVLVFAIIAIDKNPKYYLIVFPLFVIGFFVKYTVGFILPLIFLYYVLNRNIVDTFDCFLFDRVLFKQKLKNYCNSLEFKYLILSIIIGIFLSLIISKTLIIDFGGHLVFLEQSTNTLNANTISNLSIDYNSDKSFYFDHFSDILYQSHNAKFILSGILYGIFGLGLLINIINFIQTLYLSSSQKKLFKTQYFEKILLFIGVVLIFFSFFAFKELSNHMIANICLLIAFTLFFSILEKFNFNNKILTLDILFLAYFLINFIFLSLYNIKVPRYSLSFIPPFIYFIIWGLESLVEKLDGFNKFLRFGNLCSIIVLIIFLLFLFSYANAPMEFDDSNYIYRDVFDWDFENDLVDSCYFIANNDNNYHNKSFASYNHHSRMIRWYLKVNNTILENDKDIINFNGTDYVILNENRTLNNYYNIYNKGDFYVYYRN